MVMQSTWHLPVVCSLSCKILEFRGPASTSPVPSAVGASVALDKVCAAMANMEEPVRERHTCTHTDLTFLIIVMKVQQTEIHI